jgi:ribonuclease HI
MRYCTTGRTKREKVKSTRIEFDGGTTCNVPAIGFGKGYGSYQIENAPIVKLSFDCPMSANAAEVLTVFFAIMDAKKQGAKTLLVVGDSQIALKWVNVATGRRKPTKISKTSEGFQRAISFLLRAARGLDINTQWQPREISVATFGH